MDPLRDLARRAADGDADATRRILQAVSPAVYRVARTVLGGSDADAGDAAQESLVAVAGALESFRGESGFLHFACRIALRVSVSVRRRRTSRNATAARFAVEATVVGEAPLRSDDEVAAARRRELIRSLLDTLPKEQAETLGLRFVLGCTLQEVAEATGVPENTVRSRLRLAKEALRRRIAEDPAAADLLKDAG